LKAILGSCVAVAVYHPSRQVGAMAHVVLPASSGHAASPGKFADTAVPHLIELLRAAGAGPLGLVAKLAGGANMFGHAGPLQIGDKNIEAVLAALAQCGVRPVARDVGGAGGRRVTFFPETGQLSVESVGQPLRSL
jgi:chemotaxis protein CheD